MKKVETPEVPLEAFREIIVNSFAHMKVNFSSYNEIYITPTKIHIYNPGPLVVGTSPEMFASGKQGSMIRNPLIATTLYYNKTIEAFGTGFERVFRLCKDTGYRYENNQFGFTFEFLRIANNRKAGSKNNCNNSLADDLSLDEKKVLDFIIQNEKEGFSKLDIINYLGKSISTVNRILSSLIKKGLIVRVGSNKSGIWKVKNE